MCAKKDVGMLQEEEFTKKRLRELAERAYQGNQFTFTGFLSLAELSCFHEMERELSYIRTEIYGGNELCERCMIRFGNPKQLCYEQPFPIVCLRIRPLMEKFSDNLGHRDILGALMNLGTRRNLIGDIFIDGKSAYVFCQDAIAPFIIENLSRVKHTSVLCEIMQKLPALKEGEAEAVKIQIASERIDGVVAKVYKLSRSDSASLFVQKRIFVNGRLCENNSYMLKEQDRVSVRGFGRFIFAGTMGVSKKGKLTASVLVYGKA